MINRLAALAAVLLLAATPVLGQVANPAVSIKLTVDKLDLIGTALLDSVKLAIAQNPEADVSAKQRLLLELRQQYGQAMEAAAAVAATKPGVPAE